MCHASQTCVTSISSLTRAAGGQSEYNFRLKSLIFSLVSGNFFPSSTTWHKHTCLESTQAQLLGTSDENMG